jgi:hypothetical protein
MPARKPSTPGWLARMPSLPVELPKYVYPVTRAGGICFYFQVPARLRPEGWPGAIRLPIDQDKRTGKADAGELAAVTTDGKALYDRLVAEKAGKPDAGRANTLPWLIQSFDQHLKTTPREKPISKATFRQYKCNAKKVLAWSKASGHPHVALLSRPALIKFLSTHNDRPTARKHLAGYVRSLLFHAMDLGVRADNPAIKLKTETPTAQVHIWDDAELDKMVATADQLGYRAIATAMLIAHDEGPRPCDVLAFERKPVILAGRADKQTGTRPLHAGGWLLSILPEENHRLGGQPCRPARARSPGAAAGIAAHAGDEREHKARL